MSKNDAQLRLILKNVYFAINPSEAPFVSVIDAWKLAIETTEKLVLGIPQEAQNGAAILGLSAWHIYPDIHIYGNKNINVTMNDELVGAGGILSLSTCPSQRTESRGVYWSLCLSHFTFYGPPVKRQQSLEKDSRRITFKHILHATVGAILSRWRVQSSDLTQGIGIFIAILNAIGAGNQSLYPIMALMCNATMECLDDEEAWNYMSYGKRKSRFIKEPNLEETGAHKAFFGLSDLALLLSCIPQLHDRISLLQRQVKRVDLSGEDVIIFDIASSTSHEVDSGLYQTSNISRKRPKRMTKQKECRIVGAQVIQGKGKNASIFDFWIGNASSTAIYKKRIENSLQIKPPSTTLEDLKWCFDNSLVCAKEFVKLLDCRDTILNTITCLYFASMVFDSLPGLLLKAQCLETPLLDAHWAMDGLVLRSFPGHSLDMWVPAVSVHAFDNFKILAHFLCVYDFPEVHIPSGIMGLSFEDSLFVPASV
jgi:hypothetical protein